MSTDRGLPSAGALFVGTAAVLAVARVEYGWQGWLAAVSAVALGFLIGLTTPS